MIETRFNVPIGVNGTIYNVTVRELTPTEKKKLEMIGEEQKSILAEQSEREKKIEENAIALEAAQREAEVNREMLEFVPIAEKLKLFLGIKKAHFDIAKLKTERMSLERADFSKANESLERIYKEKFEMVVSGEDKVALREEATKNNISYMSIWNDEIQKEIEAQMKKKLIALEDGLNK